MAKGCKTTQSAAAPTSSAARVLAANTFRRLALLVNYGSVTVYLGGPGVTTSNGIPVLANGGAYEDVTTVDDWYAVTASGTGDLRILEVT